jgi:selenocysteine-specific elongation factor
VRLERLARGEPELPAEAPAKAPSDRLAATAAPALSASAEALEQRLRASGLEPPLDSELDAGDLALLRDAGRVVRVARNLHYHAAVLEEIKRRVVDLASGNNGAITLSQLRDELGTSRKFAQALLEHFDSEKLTIRRGDEHVLRRVVRDQ